MLNFIEIYTRVEQMKRPFIVLAVSALIISCGAGTTEMVTPPDVAAYKAVELTSKSNADRILNLERELDMTKSEVNSLQVQNKQLADSYDGLVELFKELRGLTMVMVNRMNTLMGPEKPEEKK